MRSAARKITVFALAVIGCGEAKLPQPGPEYGNEDGSVAGKDDSARAPASIVPLALEDIKTATFTATRQWRAFVFAGTKGQTVNVYVDGLRGLDTVAYLYKVSRITGRPFGTALASNDDGNDGWTLKSNRAPNPLSSSVLAFSLPETRSYAVVATTYRQWYLGSAEIAVRVPAQYAAVDLADLVQSPATYDGKSIEIRGEPAARLMCTLRACSQTNPCCNVCSGRFALGADSGARVSLIDPADAANFGCGGDSCSAQNTCHGFPAATANGSYVFRGTFQVGDGGELRLLVDSSRAADCQARGCSGTVCANVDSITTCEWRPEYQCYRSATCEAQANGQCGWTDTAALRSCLASFGQ
jgi:eight-cysteine-cluster-containing protein